jgi:hypothetical protein
LGFGVVALMALGCGGVMDPGGKNRDGEDPLGVGVDGKGASSSNGNGKGAGNVGSGATSSGATKSSTGGDIGGDTGGVVSTGGASGGTGSMNVPTRSYSGKGFVVHEWGTDTIVVGSDGSLQRGLHHEEEDLPAFVYDRLKAGALLGSMPSVTIKMETPVTYFYSDKPLTVQANVTFPKGVLTQWYPQVVSFAPELAGQGSINGIEPAALADPALDPHFPFPVDSCRARFETLHDGRLDWGSVEVLARGSAAPKVPEAPLDEFSWSYARDVDSNAIRAGTGEAERFLFYRGLGEFDLPVKVGIDAKGLLTLTNTYTETIPHVFLLNVDAERGAFTEHAEGIAQGETLSDSTPFLDGADSLDSYAESLGERVTQALDGVGLFHDEATAMVNTWKRQWFRTPGVRLLYVIPQSWTDASIPLGISPKPEQTLRVMLIRVEVITKSQEVADVRVVQSFDTAPTPAKAYFQALGRFAEPRLRRALALSKSLTGDAYLAEIQTVKSGSVSGQ